MDLPGRDPEDEGALSMIFQESNTADAFVCYASRSDTKALVSAQISTAVTVGSATDTCLVRSIWTEIKSVHNYQSADPKFGRWLSSTASPTSPDGPV